MTLREWLQQRTRTLNGLAIAAMSTDERTANELFDDIEAIEAILEDLEALQAPCLEALAERPAPPAEDAP